MKKFVYQVIFIVVLVSNSFAQSGWFWQNPLPQGNNLTSAKFTNDNTGWAVGYKGSIIKTTDGGFNWVVQYSDCDSVIIDVCFADYLTGYACSNTSMIIKTTNGGQNWILKTINGNSCSFYKIYFSNINTGYVSGYDYYLGKGIILKTTNAGDNWVNYFAEPYSNTDNYVYDFQLYNNNISYAAVGDFDIYKTINSGLNWTQLQAGWGLMYLFFTDTLNGCTCGGYINGSSYHGNIKKTTNGGINFSNVLDCYDTVFTSLNFVNSQTGYISGYVGGIRKTTNFGNSWITLNSGNSSNLNSINFRNPSTGITVGDNGVILKTSNGGDNWNLLTKGNRSNFFTSYFINENTGFCGGDYILLKTTNGGVNWISKLDTNIIFIRDVKFINGNTGFILSSHVSNAPHYILKTTNCGENWVYLGIPTNISFDYSYAFNSICVLDENNFWICGIENRHVTNITLHTGIYYKTINGGLNWITYGWGEEAFSKIFFSNENNGLLFSSSSKIFKTTNSGINLTDISFKTGLTFASCYFINSNIIWLSYYLTDYSNIPHKSYFYKSTNGGNNWQIKDSVNNALFYSIYADTNGNNWAVGLKYASRYSSSIYSSSNDGDKWIMQRSPTDFQLNNVFFINKNTGWSVGNSGTILKTTSGIQTGIYQFSKSLPKNYYLYQNYPNPFNITTKINFEISKSSSVILQVYDILGRKIETLVNEKKLPGTYEVTFDGSKFASGIYFYTLSAGDFKETKKLVLLK